MTDNGRMYKVEANKVNKKGRYKGKANKETTRVNELCILRCRKSCKENSTENDKKLKEIGNLLTQAIEEINR